MKNLDRKMGDILIKNATLVTMNPRRDILTADLLVKGDKIAAIGSSTARAATVIDAEGLTVLPGWVQTHVHLCQTLFRNLADDQNLLDWLQTRIWPLESAHDEASIRLATQLGLAELIKGGTTTILDMGTIRHTSCIFDEARKAGIRAIIGKAMMDDAKGLYTSFQETTEHAIAESLQLFKQWHGTEAGRLQYAFSPRFLLSCSAELLMEVGRLSRELGVLVHTHAAESRQEIKIVAQQSGKGNIEYLFGLGLTGDNLCLAHCIWITRDEMHILQRSGTRVLHCPSSNLKLASGIAKVPEMLELGISVSLGADGAPCNNNLDMLMEMRLASLIQKYRLEDSKTLPAQELVEMATIGGAKALKLDHLIGSIEVGKKADLILLNLNQIHNLPRDNIYSQIVYSTRPEDVRTVIVDGKMVMKDRELLTLDEKEIIARCQPGLKRLMAKIG